MLAVLVAEISTGTLLSAHAQEGSTSEGIQRVLDERAKAVGTRDEPSFLSTVDESATEFFRAQQSWIRRISSIPIVDYSLRVDLDESPELTRKRDIDRWGPDTRVVVVEERFKIQGFDRLGALNVHFFTFTSNGGDALRISSDSDVSDFGLNSARQPWDFGDVISTTSERFMVVTHPGDSDFATTLLGLAESAMEEVDRIWRSDWHKRVVVFVPANRQELEKLLDTTVDVSNFVAFAASAVNRREGWEPGSARIILNRENFAKFSAQGQRAVFAHELLHVATREASGPFVSLSVEEGLAQLAEPLGSVATPSLRRQVARGEFKGTLPEDVDFVSGSGDDISLAYQTSFSALEFLRKKLGEQRLVEFYEKLGSARMEPGTARFHLDRILREVPGLGLQDFEREWAASVRDGN